MLPTAFKAFGILYLVMQNTIINLDYPKLELKDLYLRDELKSVKSRSEKQNFLNKIQAYNTKSDKEIRFVSEQAIVHSKALDYADNEEKRVIPIITQIPIPITPVEPVIPTITLTPTHSVTLTPIPTQFIPEPTFVIIPSIPPKCGCYPVGLKETDIVCPVYIKEMPCPDSF